jgi:N-methylhydantoinase B/oxoprolinase/acetone carboxylase alpha subunit
MKYFSFFLLQVVETKGKRRRSHKPYWVCGGEPGAVHRSLKNKQDGHRSSTNFLKLVYVPAGGLLVSK